MTKMYYTYVLIFIAVMMICYLLISAIYTIITTYRQSKIFINGLKIGDESNLGEIIELDGDWVVIKREPLRFHKSCIQPKEIKGNKLFLLKKQIK